MPEQRVRKNKYVEFTYQIIDENGELIEQINLPVGYAYGGAQQMFDQVEAAIEGLAAGDKVSVELPAGEAYGEHDPEMTFTDDISNVPRSSRNWVLRLKCKITTVSQSSLW